MGMAVIVLLLFIVLIFLHFTYSYWQLSNDTGKVKTDIDIARRLIDYQDNGVESFYRDYEEINTNLKNNPSVSHAWQEFIEHITFDKNIAGDYVVKNSIQPSSYFSVDNLLAKNTRVKRSHQVTWNLLGLGTVGAAIVFILAMASMGAVSDYVLVLVKIAKYVNYALVCFAMGLGFALFFSTLQKMEIINIEDKLHEFNTNLEKALVFSTANQVLDEVLNALVEQNKKIDGISNNIALSNNNFSEANSVREQQSGELVHKLTENFSDKLQQLVEQGQSSIEVLTELQKSMSDHSQSFSDKLQYLSTELDQLVVETLAELKQHNSTNADKFYDRLQQLFAQLLPDKLQQLSTELDQLVVKTLTELKQHSSANADRFHDKLQQLSVHQEQHITVALEKLRESNTSNTDRLYDRLVDLSASQEQFDYEVQATIKKQPREDHEHEGHEGCSSENDDEEKSLLAGRNLLSAEEEESSEINTPIPFERVS